MDVFSRLDFACLPLLSRAARVNAPLRGVMPVRYISRLREDLPF